jgi:hypothetical protein
MTKNRLFAIGTALILTLGFGGAMVGPVNPVGADGSKVSFSVDVFPIFKGRCIVSPAKRSGSRRAGLI